MEENNETWFFKYWRPAMAWQYLIVCLFDFIIAPIMHTAAEFWSGQNIAQWDPITLKGAAFYHLAMAGIIGLYALGRSQEKIAAITNKVTPPPE